MFSVQFATNILVLCLFFSCLRPKTVVLKVVDINPQGSIGPSKGSKIAKGSNGGQ